MTQVDRNPEFIQLLNKVLSLREEKRSIIEKMQTFRKQHYIKVIAIERQIEELGLSLDILDADEPSIIDKMIQQKINGQ